MGIEVEQLDLNPQEKKSLRDYFKINRKYLVLKAVNFFSFAGYACILPFSSVLYQDWGISVAQIGLLGAVRPVVTAISAPLISSIADRTQKHKIFLIVSMLVSSLLKFSNYWVAHVFYQLVIISLSMDLIGSSVDSLVNNSIVSALDDKDDFGKQRLWGAIGWGLAAFVVGTVTTFLKTYEIMFWAFIVFEIIAVALISWKMEIVPPKKPEQKDDEMGFFKSIKTLLSSPEMLCLFLAMVALGAGNAIHTNFFFLFLKDLGATESLMGSTLTATCAAELPFFFFSGSLIKKLSAKGVLAATLFLYASRLAYYWAFLTEPWMAFPSEIVHGITFACFYSASVTYCATIAPPGLEATSQAVISAAFNGVGPVIGGVLGGLAFEKYGARLVFLFTALFIYTTLLVLLPSFFHGYLSTLRSRIASSPKFTRLKARSGAGEYVMELELEEEEELEGDVSLQLVKPRRAGSGELNPI